MLDERARGVEGLFRARGFDDDVRAHAVRDFLDGGHGVGLLAVYRDVHAEALRELELAVEHVDHDDLIGALELGALRDYLSRIARAHDDDVVAELHAAVEPRVHRAGGRLAEARYVHVEVVGDGLKLEGLRLEVFREVVVPTEGHDLVADLVVADAAADRDDGAAALMSEKERELRRLAEFRCLGRHKPAVEALVRTADAHEVVLDYYVVFAADELAFDELYVVRPVEARGLGYEFFHCFRSFARLLVLRKKYRRPPVFRRTADSDAV